MENEIVITMLKDIQSKLEVLDQTVRRIELETTESVTKLKENVSQNQGQISDILKTGHEAADAMTKLQSSWYKKFDDDKTSKDSRFLKIEKDIQDIKIARTANAAERNYGRRFWYIVAGCFTIDVPMGMLLIEIIKYLRGS